MKKFSILLIALLGLTVFLIACGAGGEATAATEIKVAMTDFTFDPMELTIAAGKEITLTATNNGAVQHEFVIIKKGMAITTPFDADDEDKVFWEVEVDPGGSKNVTFTAPTEPGEYQLVCGTPGHFEAGMVGKIIVK